MSKRFIAKWEKSFKESRKGWADLVHQLRVTVKFAALLVEDVTGTRLDVVTDQEREIWQKIKSATAEPQP